MFTELLEGEGETGQVLHRADELSLASNGGGMIRDLGLHALSPAAAVLGGEAVVNSLEVAVCSEHLQHYVNKGHAAAEIAETYARAKLRIGNVPVDFAVGKYVLGQPAPGRNQRRLLIVGSKGQINLDMSKCEMAVYEGDSVMPSWSVGVNRADFSLYYPVLRAALESRETPDLTRTAFTAQRDILKLLDPARQSYGSMPQYARGAEIHEITAARA